jgi:acyl transferase domain-containing protein
VYLEDIKYVPWVLGTGTSVGDFTEVSALGSFFSKHTHEDIPIGSVKANIGHLESGAGAASVIKVLLMMKNECLVPSIHSKPLNPKLPFRESKLKVCQSVEKWSKNKSGRRIASVNCFGFGGTNSHAIITDFQQNENMAIHRMRTCLDSKNYVILSAEDITALYNVAEDLLHSLHNDVNLANLSSTTAHFRSHYRLRKVFVAEKLPELVNEVECFIDKEMPVKAAGKEKPKVIFVYCGVGTAWRKMCKELLTQDQIFRKTIQEIDGYLSAFTTLSMEFIFGKEEDISDPLKNHLAIFACQVGLTHLWNYLGVYPNTIVGQSVGEVAAAYACGTLSLKDAVRVIYFRSLNLAEESAGKMIIIQNCPIEVIEDKCCNLKHGKANIAVYHSYHSCAVSGDVTAVEELEMELVPQKAKIIHLDVKCAYHSHLTKDASLKLQQTLAELEWQYPKITIISTVTGRLADNAFGSSSYWSANVYKPVLFRHAVEEAKSRNTNSVFLEIGPNPVLRAHLSSIFPDSIEEALPSMRRNCEVEIFQKSCVDMFEKGIPIRWENIVPYGNKILPFPKYQFSKRKHLVKSEKIQNLLNGKQNNRKDMLITQMPGGEVQFKIVISQENTPFVYEHIVDGSTVVPGALYGEIGLEIGNMLLSKNGIKEVCVSWSILRACLVKDNVQTIVLKTRQENQELIHFDAYLSGSQALLSSGKIRQVNIPRIPVMNVERLISLLRAEKESHILYTILQRSGFQHGLRYQTIKKCVIRDDEAVCEVHLSEETMNEIPRTCLHPVILDTMFQSCLGVKSVNGIDQKTRILPIRVLHLIQRQRPLQQMICYTTLVSDNARSACFNILLMQNNGTIVAEIFHFEVEKVNSTENIQGLSFYETWEPVNLPASQLQEMAIIVLSWNTDYLSSIEQSFRQNQQTANVCSFFLTKTFDNELLSARRKIADTQKISVIFAPGIPGIDENTTGQRLMESVRKTSHAFLQLLKSIFKENWHLLIVTNETQPCESSKTRVVGAELWGMARSVSYEGTELSLTLLDIDSLSDFALETITKICSKMYGHTRSRHVPCEYAIRRDVIYANELVKQPDNFHSRLYKKSFQKVQQPVCIRQKFEGSAPFFLAAPCSVDFVTPKSNLICVMPALALACTADTFFNHNNDSVELYCSDAETNGKEITVCEVVGTTRCGSKDIEVIACCQMELKSEMEIDKNCIVAKSCIDGYKLGYLHAAIIALTIADHIEKHSQVFVEFNEKGFQIYNFLLHLLDDKKCSVSNLKNHCGKKTQNTSTTELVLLSGIGYEDKECIQLLFPNAQQCIALKGTLPSTLTTKDPMITFHVIDAADLFKPQNLRRVSQRAFQTLQSVSKKMKAQEVPVHTSHLNVKQMLTNIEIRTTQEFLIRRDSAYIVVGGLTGLGWLIIKYLSKRKAKKIVSLSRRQLSCEMEEKICNIKNLYGVDVIHRAVDITDLNDLTKVIQSLQQQMSDVPIRGVFQGAAVISDCIVPKMGQEQFDLPLIVKVLGTWNLHVVTKHMNLEIFTMHSSIMSVFGNYSQANYAAGNAFQDSFAYYRRSVGLPAQVINWGALDIGMGSDPTLKGIFSDKGINLMSADQICCALTQMYLSGQTQGIFANFDIKNLFTGSNLKWSKFKGLIPVEYESLQKASSSEEETYESGDMLNLIKETSARVLMIDTTEIENIHSLAHFGVDSQNAIEIINTIFSITKVRIPILMLLSSDYSVQELAKFLSDKITTVNSEELSDNAKHNSKSLSFMTRHLSNFQQQKSYIEFSFSIPSYMRKPQVWRTAMQFIIRMNSTLRGAGSMPDQMNSVTVMDVEDFILPFEHKKTKELFKLEIRDKNVPLAVAYQDIGNQAILHVFCNQSHCDAFCGSIIEKDLQTISTYVVAGKSVPAWLDKVEMDLYKLYTKSLHTVADKSKDYWKKRLHLCKTSASLTNVGPLLDSKEAVTKISLPLADVSVLYKFALDNDWTMRAIVCSAFQIALHKITNAERVPILMEVDLRSKIRECQVQISPCANLIPVISPNFLRRDTTIRDVIVENKTILEEADLHSLYSIGDIMKLQGFDSKLHSTHSFLFQTIANADHQYINIISTQTERDPRFETLLHVQHNETQKSMAMELHFCQKRVSACAAFKLTEFISELIQTIPMILTKMLKHLELKPFHRNMNSSPNGKNFFSNSEIQST